jgi:integrase
MVTGDSFERSLSQWLTLRCLNRKPKTVKFYNEVRRVLLAATPDKGKVCSHFLPQDLLAIASACEGQCPSRWNQICAALGAVLPHLPKLKRRRLNCREFTPPGPSQFTAFLAALDALPRTHAGLITRFYCFTGLRYEEGMALTWAHVQPERIDVPGAVTKSGKGRSVPLVPGAQIVLDQLRALKVPGGRVLPQQHPRKAMEIAAQKAGLGHWSPHLCRHYFATCCIQGGVDMPTVARWLGHQDGGALLARTYFHLADSHSRDMAQKVRIAA